MIEATVDKSIEKAASKTSVFLAWSGPVSREMAILLKEYLPLFARNISIFMSEEITPGKRSLTELSNVLSETKFGILCLTPENLTSPWIHFEAGALSKTVDDDTYVCPLLLNVKKSDLKDPLASFHATLFEEDEFKKLIKALVAASEGPLDDGQLASLMEVLWPKIEVKIQKMQTEIEKGLQEKGGRKRTKPQTDLLLEEVVVSTREQGRLMAMIAEQNETVSVKELNRIVKDIKGVQRLMVDQLHELRHNRRDCFAETNSSTADIIQRLDNSIRVVMEEDLLESSLNPENMLQVLLDRGLFDAEMKKYFAGREDAIGLVKHLMHRYKQ